MLMRIVRIFSFYFLLIVLLSVLSMCIFVLQPLLNNEIKKLIQMKNEDDTKTIIVEIVTFFVLFKIANSIVYVVSNFYFMILGVKIDMGLVLAVAKSSVQEPKMVACIEDDCERLWNLPYSSLNSGMKIFEFVILSSMLISRLPTYHATIAVFYWVFLLLSMYLAFYVSKLNLKIMSHKQKRINLKSDLSQILKERK